MLRLNKALILLSALLLMATAAAAASGDNSELRTPSAENECMQAEEANCTTAPEPLADDELAELSQRDEQPGDEVTGGALSNENLTYVVIALAAAVIVLIAAS